MTQEEIQIRLGVDSHALQQGLQSVGSQIGDWANTMATRIAGAFAAEKIVDQYKTVLEYAREIAHAAEAAGVSVEFVQKLQEAANKTGIEFDKVSGSLVTLEKNMGDARNGSEEAIKKFEKWGISIRGLNVQEVFTQILEKMEGIGDASERAALRMELMGKAAKTMTLDAKSIQGHTIGSLSQGQVESLQREGGAWSEIWRAIKVTTGLSYLAATGRLNQAPKGITEEQIARRIAEMRHKRFNDILENSEHPLQAFHEESRIQGEMDFRAGAIKTLMADREKAEKDYIAKTEEETDAKNAQLAAEKYTAYTLLEAEKSRVEAAKKLADELRKRAEAERQDADLFNRIRHASRHLKDAEREKSQYGGLFPTVDELASNWGPFMGAARRLRLFEADQVAARAYGNIGRAEFDKTQGNQIRGWLATQGIISPEDHLAQINENISQAQEDLNALLNMAEGAGVPIIPTMGQ